MEVSSIECYSSDSDSSEETTEQEICQPGKGCALMPLDGVDCTPHLHQLMMLIVNHTCIS